MNKADEAIDALDKLDEASLRAVLKTILTNPTKVKVEEEVLSKLLQSESFDIKMYGSAANRAIKNNNETELSNIIIRADKLQPLFAIQAIARICGVLSHSIGIDTIIL
jgi:hypothetical protein